jgi:hypothetical protein
MRNAEIRDPHYGMRRGTETLILLGNYMDMGLKLMNRMSLE